MSLTQTTQNSESTPVRRWKRAGLFSDLDSHAALPLPEADNSEGAIPDSLLRRYYSANGDMVEAVWRRQADRFVEVSRAQRPDTVLKLVELALPSIGPLRVTHTREALVISAGGHEVSISRVLGYARIRTADERPRDVMEAVNRLLALEGRGRRFVELGGPIGRHVFVALRPRQARALQHWGATRHADVGALWRFAGWDRVVAAHMSQPAG